MDGITSRMITLSGTNLIQKPRIEDLLYYKDIHALLEGDVAKLKDMSDEDWNKLDRKATWFIRQWLNDTVIVSQQRLQHIPCGRN